jgi:hypothetical protein
LIGPEEEEVRFFAHWLGGSEFTVHEWKFDVGRPQKRPGLESEAVSKLGLTMARAILHPGKALRQVAGLEALPRSKERRRDT